MELVAYWIGYTIMVVAGLGVMLLAVGLAAAGVWRLWVGAVNAYELMEALEEWRKNHPERVAEFRRRNGLRGD